MDSSQAAKSVSQLKNCGCLLWSTFSRTSVSLVCAAYCAGAPREVVITCKLTTAKQEKERCFWKPVAAQLGQRSLSRRKSLIAACGGDAPIAFLQTGRKKSGMKKPLWSMPCSGFRPCGMCENEDCNRMDFCYNVLKTSGDDKARRVRRQGLFTIICGRSRVQS